MKRLFLALLVLISFSAFAAPTYYAGEFKQDNMADDTLMLRYKNGTADTSKLMGMARGHQLINPSLYLHKTYFYKITPDSVDSISVSDCQFWIEEVDYNGLTEDTVYTVMADTSCDTLSTTGVAADSGWTKKAFSPNPSNAYRVICSGTSSASSAMYSTLKIWFHFIKKYGVFQ